MSGFRTRGLVASGFVPQWMATFVEPPDFSLRHLCDWYQSYSASGKYPGRFVARCGWTVTPIRVVEVMDMKDEPLVVTCLGCLARGPFKG